MSANANFSPRMRVLIAIIAAVAIAVVWAAWAADSSTGPGNATAAEKAPSISLLSKSDAEVPAANSAVIRDRLSGDPSIAPTGKAKSVRLTDAPNATLNAWLGTDNQTCFELFTGDEGSSTPGCVTDEYIASGKVVFAALDPSTNGKYVVAGIVPDGISTVSLDGRPTKVLNNVFSATLPSGPRSVSWTDSDGKTLTTSVGIR